MINRKSSADTSSRISFSTFATSPSETEIRVPVGALMLITNWPASERGKKERPSLGNSSRLAANAAPHNTRVTAGRRNVNPTALS